MKKDEEQLTRLRHILRYNTPEEAQGYSTEVNMQPEIFQRELRKDQDSRKWCGILRGDDECNLFG